MRFKNGQTVKGGRSGDLLRISEEISERHGLSSSWAASTELVLLEVDPTRLHVYWHIEHADLFRARVAAGDPCASLVLRVLPSDPSPDTANSAPPIQVKGLSESHYVDVPEPGVACYAEIGLKLRDESIYPLVRSNIAYPPRAEESLDYEMIPVDTRVRPESPPVDDAFGQTMSRPLPMDRVDGPFPASSWS